VAFSSGATFASRLLRRVRPQPRDPLGTIPNRVAYPYGQTPLWRNSMRIDGFDGCVRRCFKSAAVLRSSHTRPLPFEGTSEVLRAS
jgi:hypothetical protein